MSDVIEHSGSSPFYVLIPYRTQFVTFTEYLVISAAVSRGDFATVNHVHFDATVRTMAIPASVLSGRSNYSSHRAYA